MSGYCYQIEKPKLLTDEGQRTFLAVRDRAFRLLLEAGAFKLFYACKGVSDPSSWFLMACVDRMVEIGEITEITGQLVAGQNRVFVAAKKDGR